MDESSLVALWRHFNNANIIYQFYQNKIHHVHRRKISIVHSTTCRLLFIFYEQKKYYCYHRRCGLAKGKNLIAFHVSYVRMCVYVCVCVVDESFCFHRNQDTRKNWWKSFHHYHLSHSTGKACSSGESRLCLCLLVSVYIIIIKT